MHLFVLGVPIKLRSEGGVPGPRPHCCQATLAFCFSELESTRELNRSTVDRVCCDLTDAGVRNS